MMRALGLLLILGAACCSGDSIPRVEVMPKEAPPTAPCIGDYCPTSTTFVPPTVPCVAELCPTEAPATEEQTTEESTTEEPTEEPTTEESTTEESTTQTSSTQTSTTQKTTTETTTTQPSTKPPGDFRRTVVFVYLSTIPGDYLFLRGGLGSENFPECKNYPEDYTSPCAIPIEVKSLGNSSNYDEYNAWRVGDDRLDWGGAQPGQGTYKGKEASGTPMAWTTDNPEKDEYQQLNHWGDHYWMVDMEMDCAETEEGWFEFKAIKVAGSAVSWENDITQLPCNGDAAETPPYSGKNHMARCGYINRFNFNDGICEVNMI